MKKKKKMGLLFLESGTPTFWLGLLLFIKRESRTPTFKILVRTLLTVKIRKSQDFLASISGCPGDQMFSLTFRNSTSIFLNSHLWSKTTILKLINT